MSITSLDCTSPRMGTKIGFRRFSTSRSDLLPVAFSQSQSKSRNFPFNSNNIACKMSASCSSLTTAISDVATPTTFGFKNLMETVTVDVHRAEGRPLNVPLIAPFAIASSRLEKVENVAIRIELSNGCVGWGEAPILPSVTVEDQPTALAKAAEACEFLQQSSAMTLSSALGGISRLLPGHQFASVRAGVEMALIDAVANSIRIPLWRLFGGVSDTITTDITIPIVSADEAAKLASEYRKLGFKTLKLKVGKDLNSDVEVLKAVHAVHPDCSFVLDANEGYTPKEAVEALQKLHEVGVTPILFEQPVHRDDWEGLGHVSHIAKKNYGVSVAADESCRSISDARRLVNENLVDVINIKLAKVGVVGALEIIELVRISGLDLMIGGMVETRLAVGFAGHLAAGMGCFRYVDLDTPLLLAEDPVYGGYEVTGAVYKFTNARGHGGFLHWKNIDWYGTFDILCRLSLVLSDTVHVIVLKLFLYLYFLPYLSACIAFICLHTTSILSVRYKKLYVCWELYDSSYPWLCIGIIVVYILVEELGK